MDVNAFLNDFINEEVYVSQPPNFEDHINIQTMCMSWKAHFMDWSKIVVETQQLPYLIII